MTNSSLFASTSQPFVSLSPDPLRATFRIVRARKGRTFVGALLLALFPSLQAAADDSVAPMTPPPVLDSDAKGPSVAPPSDETAAAPTAVPEEVPSPAAPAPGGPSATGESSLRRSATPTKEDPLFRRVLQHSAEQAGLRRYGEASVGLISAGAMIGVGFAAQAPDMTWSHVLWVSGSLVGAASLAHLLVPSDLEQIALGSEGKSEERLRAAWAELAARQKVERRVGAIFSGVLGTAAIVTGIVVLEDGLGDLSADNQKILGTALVSGGALTIGDGIYQWLVPSIAERGFSTVEDATSAKVSCAASPTPGGVAVSVSGVF